MIASAASARRQKPLAASARAFSATVRNPSLLRAQLAFGAAWTAEWAFTVAIGVVAFRDGGVQAVGLVAFVRLAPSALLAPLGTSLADRIPRHRFLVWSCLIRATATAAAAAVFAEGGPNVAVYALAVIGTVAFTTFRPAHSALLPALCKTPLELTSANVVRGLLDSLSVLLGPLAAALLLDLGSPAAVFAATAALSLASGVLLLRLSYEAPPRGLPQPLRRIVRETVAGFHALARYRDAGLLVALAVAQTLTRGFLNVFLVVVAIELLDMGAPGVGVLTAAVGAGAIAGSLAASMFVSGRRLAALEGAGVVLWGLPLTLSGALPHEPAVLGLMGVIGVGNALVDIGLYTLPARLVPEELLARVFGAKESLTAMAVALGSLVTPFVVELLGIRGALAVLGLVAPALVALAWQRLRAIDASIGHLDEQIKVLNNVDIFRPLPMPAIDNLALHVDHARLAAGEEVFHQGDHGDRFYVIEDGEAEVIGDGRLIGTMRPGDGFGEIALLHDTLRTTTVRARTALRLYTPSTGTTSSPPSPVTSRVRARRTRWCSTGSAPSIRAAGRPTDRGFAVEDSCLYAKRQEAADRGPARADEGSGVAADRDRRPLLLRLAELVSSPRGNPTGEQASRLARRVAHNLQAAGWRLERVLSDNGGEYGAQALAYSWARQGLPIAAYAEKIRDIRAQTGRMIS